MMASLGVVHWTEGSVTPEGGKQRRMTLGTCPYRGTASQNDGGDRQESIAAHLSTHAQVPRLRPKFSGKNYGKTFI